MWYVNTTENMSAVVDGSPQGPAIADGLPLEKALAIVEHHNSAAYVGYCRNCEAVRNHSKRNTDLCCDDCHWIAFSFHDKAKP